VVGRQDKFLSPQQLQDQHRELSGQFQSLVLAYQSQAAEIEVGRRWRLEREEAVLSSQQQSVVMEQCDQSRMNLRWQTKELLLGKMKSFSNKRLLKTVLEDLEMLEDLSMVWRSLSFSGDEVSITAVNCDEANRCFLKQKLLLDSWVAKKKFEQRQVETANISPFGWRTAEFLKTGLGFAGDQVENEAASMEMMKAEASLKKRDKLLKSASKGSSSAAGSKAGGSEASKARVRPKPSQW
jgi:hypothetical protein